MSKIDLKELKKLVGEVIRESRESHLLERPEILDEKSILKNKHPFKAVFMFGPAGAGKGYILKNVLTGTNGAATKSLLSDFATANPDDRIEEVFPAFGISTKFANAAEGGDAELETLQQKSRVILQNASRAHTSNLLSIANPMIFDTTGESVGKMVGRIKALTKLGYEVAVMIINVPTQASVERDAQRDRTVGASRTASISQQFQEEVVQMKKYHAALEGVEGVTMLVDEPFNNIFDLSTGELLTKPTAITPDMLPDELNPEKNPEAAANEKAKMDQANQRLQGWVDTPVSNPIGVTLLKGMRTLVKASGGKLGQNMNDLALAMANEEFSSIPEVAAGAQVLSDLGGVSMVLKKKKGGGKKLAPAAGGDQPAMQKAVRGKKATGDATIRGLTTEKLDFESLAAIIREEIKKIRK
jgi:hypothetical protein